MIPPDDYRVFTTAGSEFEYSNPAVVRALLGDGKPVTVRLNQTTIEKLDLTRTVATTSGQ